jgi:hypothetical protein
LKFGVAVNFFYEFRFSFISPLFEDIFLVSLQGKSDDGDGAMVIAGFRRRRGACTFSLPKPRCPVYLQCGLDASTSKALVSLFADKQTIPFIARYRRNVVQLSCDELRAAFQSFERAQ